MSSQVSAAHLRRKTLLRVEDLGFPQPPAHLPLLEDNEFPFTLREPEDVVQRALVLNVRINIAFRMPPDAARRWLTTNGLMSALTQRESELLDGAAAVDEHEQLQVEGLWALAWALGLTQSLDHRSYCGEELATLFPDLRADESLHAWRERADCHLRTTTELMAELDLLYVMTWGLVDARISGSHVPGEVQPYVLWERRRALEFVRADSEDWDEVDLST